MEQKVSYGFVDITGVTAAMDVLDLMCKSADVTLTTWERKMGGRLVTVIVQGDIASVTQAVKAVSKGAIKEPVTTGIIANPSEEIIRLIQISAKRLKK